MAVMVRPVVGLQSKLQFPEEQEELQLDFSKSMTGAEVDSSAGALSVFPFEMMQSKWYKQVAAQGQIPLENPICFGHIITPVAVTVPGGKSKARRKTEGQGDQEIDDFLTNAVFLSQSQSLKGTGYGYMGFHFATHNQAVNFEKSDDLETTALDFIVNRSNEDEDSLWRGFRVVHTFGLVAKDFEFRRVSFPRWSDGVVVEGRQGPVYASVFLMYKFTMKDIRRPLSAISEADEEAENKVAENLQEA